MADPIEQELRFIVRTLSSRGLLISAAGESELRMFVEEALRNAGVRLESPDRGPTGFPHLPGLPPDRQAEYMSALVVAAATIAELAESEGAREVGAAHVRRAAVSLSWWPFGQKKSKRA